MALDLSRLALAAVPDTIGQLTRLTVLWLFGNQLSAVPDSIGQLTSLTDLDLRDNQLTAVPDLIGQLTSVTKLNIEGNPRIPTTGGDSPRRTGGARVPAGPCQLTIFGREVLDVCVKFHDGRARRARVA